MEPISRRSFIAGVCAVVALGGSEVPAAANTAVKKLPGGRLSVDLKAVPAFAKVGGATKQAANPKDGKFSLLSSN